MNYTGFMLGLICAVLVLYAVYMLAKEYFIKPATVSSPPVLPYVSPVVKEEMTENQRKGLAFEKFTISYFDENYFHFIDWRGDKSYGGRYPASSGNPDLVYEYCHRETRIRFAVECKWRADFYQEQIEWAKPQQVLRYFDFQKQEGIRVFVVIGIGGTPEQPQDLYVIPLNSIRRDAVYLSQGFLYAFSKRAGSGFFMNPRTGILS